MADGRVLSGQLAGLAAKYDDTIIDAGGRDSAALRAALARSDLLVVPVQPRAVDLWALGDIATLVQQVQDARADDGRPPLRVLAVLNLADPGDNPDTADAAKALTDFPQLPPVGTAIRRRKAVANAMAHGLSVAEMAPRDGKACVEISSLVSYMFDVKELANGDH